MLNKLTYAGISIYRDINKLQFMLNFCAFNKSNISLKLSINILEK